MINTYYSIISNFIEDRTFEHVKNENIIEDFITKDINKNKLI